MTSKFDSVYRASMRDPQKFWRQAAEAIHWFKPADEILDGRAAPHHYRWFSGALCNSCYNAVDRHVEDGRGDQLAIIYDSPMTATQSKISYAELRRRVASFAGGLRKLGLRRGDRVIIYLPMIPEAIVAMLACARLGVVHSVVFGGFAAAELAVRIRDAGAKAVITATCGLEPNREIAYMPLVNQALREVGHAVEHVIIYQRPQVAYDFLHRRDCDWLALESQSGEVDCVAVEATDPLYILYTSGTTGKPKGVMRDNGGHMVALAWSMRNIYDISAGEVFWAASDVGWVVGHSYIVYGPLLHGCTTVIYEGKPVGTPDAGAFWRIIDEHSVASLFTAPTAVRAIRREDPDAGLIGDYDLGSLRTLFLAGERCDPETLHWAERHLGVPVIDHWWQTETGWSIAANCLGIGKLAVKAGSPARPVPGYDVHILGEDGRPMGVGEMGAVCIKLPLPPGSLPTLWNADARFIDSYLARYPGYYESGDAGYIDEDGYIFIMARTDDVINVAGHRLSTGAMEEVLAEHPDIAECAVFGANDALKGQLPLAMITLKANVRTAPADIVQQAIALVRQRIGPVAAFKACAVVKRLPKTRSGKILRGTMQKIADGEDCKVPATIDDPQILVEVTKALRGLGYPRD